MAAAGGVTVSSLLARFSGLTYGQIQIWRSAGRIVEQTARTLSEQFERLAKVVDQSERQMLSFARIAAVSGGTMAQAGRAGGVLGLAGEDPASTAARARGLRERLASSPYAQAAFGAFTLPAGTGQLINEARLFNEVSRQIIFGRSAEAARMKAQVAGLEELLPLRNADRKLTEEALQLAESRAAFVSREAAREQANLNALKRANEERRGIIREAFTREITPYLEFGERVRGVFLDLGGAFARSSHPIQNFIDEMARIYPVLVPLADLSRYIQNRANKPADDPQSRMAEHIVDLAHEISMWRREMAGGGPRARGAVPPGLRGMALEEGLRARALRLGAWEL